MKNKLQYPIYRWQGANYADPKQLRKCFFSLSKLESCFFSLSKNSTYLSGQQVWDTMLSNPWKSPERGTKNYFKGSL